MTDTTSAQSPAAAIEPCLPFTPADRLLLRGASERRYAVLELSGFTKPGPAPRGTTSPAQGVNGAAAPVPATTFTVWVPRSCDRA